MDFVSSGWYFVVSQKYNKHQCACKNSHYPYFCHHSSAMLINPVISATTKYLKFEKYLIYLNYYITCTQIGPIATYTLWMLSAKFCWYEPFLLAQIQSLSFCRHNKSNFSPFVKSECTIQSCHIIPCSPCIVACVDWRQNGNFQPSFEISLLIWIS